MPLVPTPLMTVAENSNLGKRSRVQGDVPLRKSFAFTSDNLGTMESPRRFWNDAEDSYVDVPKSDSSEISLTDVSHYFDSDPTVVLLSCVVMAKHWRPIPLRRMPKSGILSETVRLDVWTKLSILWHERGCWTTVMKAVEVSEAAA